MASKGNLRRPGPGGFLRFFSPLCCLLGEDVVQLTGKWPRGRTLGLLGQNVASRVLEAGGLSEEVLSVLKVLGFVFTEQSLQALVLRTVGTTHPWDVQVVPGGRSAQGHGGGRAERVLCRLHGPGLLWLGACEGPLCQDWALHRLTPQTPSP